MNRQQIKKITESFGTAVAVSEAIGNIPLSEWFLVKIRPYPLYSDLKSLIIDIHYDKEIDVFQGGRLECNSNSSMLKNTMNLPPIVEKVINDIRDVEFTVVIHPGFKGIYDGQPLVIPIEPELNLELYPDHPHLNHGRWVQGEHPFFFPESLCYTDDIPSLGTIDEERIISALGIVSIWFFRHLVWLETRKWIGLNADPAPDRFFPYVLNPIGPCRCGNGKIYKNCHLSSDLEAALLVPNRRSERAEELLILTILDKWEAFRGEPRRKIIKELKDRLIV